MSKDLKELTLEFEYVSFMIAIMLVRTTVTSLTIRNHWTAFDLAKFLNDLNISRQDKTQFYVDEVALHQGLSIFINTLQQLGHSLISGKGKKGEFMIQKFNDLLPKTIGYKIILCTLTNLEAILPTGTEFMLDSVKKMDDLTITTKNIPTTALHKCWYIIHKDTGHVSTSQFKAWNDTI